MALLKILEVPDAILRKVSAPVPRVDTAVRGLIDDMFATMYAAPGIGLAAIQVGAASRVMVIDLQREGDDGIAVREPRIFVNPEVIEASPELSVYNEGCLSIPDQYADVARPARVRARWVDADGSAHDDWFDGLMATCIQHEIDHLNGVLFIDHLTRLKRDILLRKLAKARREEK